MPEFWPVFWTVVYVVASLAIIFGGFGLIALWAWLMRQSK